MDEHDEFYVFEEQEKFNKMYPYDSSLGGKWIFFVRIASMESLWKKACSFYRKGELLGIRSLKASTAKPNPQRTTTEEGVIIFHCGPHNNSELMIRYGTNLVSTLNYFNICGFISYKTDEQSTRGTRASGYSSNSCYTLPVPRRWREFLYHQAPSFWR